MHGSNEQGGPPQEGSPGTGSLTLVCPPISTSAEAKSLSRGLRKIQASLGLSFSPGEVTPWGCLCGQPEARGLLLVLQSHVPPSQEWRPADSELPPEPRIRAAFPGVLVSGWDNPPTPYSPPAIWKYTPSTSPQS